MNSSVIAQISILQLHLMPKLGVCPAGQCSVICAGDEAVHSAQVLEPSVATCVCSIVLYRCVRVTCSRCTQQAAISTCRVTMASNETCSSILPGQPNLKARYVYWEPTTNGDISLFCLTIP